MTYNKVISSQGSATPYSFMRAQFAASGWTESPTHTYTAPDGSTSVVFTDGGVYNTNGYIRLSATPSGFISHLYTGVTNTASSDYGVEISISNDHVYISLTGPPSGATGAPSGVGSATSFFLLTRIKPYFAADSAVNRRWAVVSTNPVTAPWSGTLVSSWSTHQCYVVGASSGVAQAAELMTMRPAVQDIVAVGYQPPSWISGSGLQAWPYVVVEDNTSGLRGRLENVFFINDKFTTTGDNTLVPPSLREVYIGGERYVIPHPPFMPATSPFNYGYTPLGVAGVNMTNANGVSPGAGWPVPTSAAGGPVFAIKKGNGA